MTRFPVLKTFRTIFLLLAVLIMLGSFIGGIYGSFAASDYLAYSSGYSNYYNNTDSNGNYVPPPLPPPVIQVFLAVYIIGCLFSLIFIFFAEMMKLGMNIEDHLFHIRNPNKAVSDIRRAHRIKMAREKVLEETQKAAGELLERGRRGAAAAASQGRILAQKGIEGVQQQASARSQSTSLQPAPASTAALTPPENGSLAPVHNDPRIKTASQSMPAVKSSPTTTVEVLQAEAEKPLATTSGDAEKLYREAYKLFQQKQYDEAIPLLDKAITIDPKHANSYGCRAKCYQALGENDRYQADVQTFRKLTNR